MSRDQMPPHSTTASQPMRPDSVFTAATWPFFTSMPVTDVFSKMRTPPVRAPLAKAMTVPTGSVWPSPGMNRAPTIWLVSTIG